MSRPIAAFLLLVPTLGLVFGLRTWLHWRATGSTGFRGISGAPGSAEWLGGVLFVVGLALGVSAPVLEALGVVGSHVSSHPAALDALALGLLGAGVAGTIWAQGAMGDSWRIGVAAEERTELVLRGPFRLVRNPIFSAMIATAAGFALFLPNTAAIASLVLLVVAIELQVRRVEEPYLLAVHGERYAAYTRRVGRFFPGLGLRA